MTTEEKGYVKLPGSGYARGWASFFGYSRAQCTLWLAKDHLLQAELTGGYQESCKRFYFRDIQTLILIKTNNWRITNFILGVLTGVILIIAAACRGGAGEIPLLIVGGVFGLIFLANLVAGPTCNCHLKTAVHQQELPSLRRLRRARKIFKRLLPLIEQAQGTVSQAEVAARFQNILQEVNLTEPAAVGQPLIYAATVQPYRSRMHRLLYTLLLVDAAVSVLNIFLPSVTVIIIAMINQLALLACLILALVKQDETDLKPALKSLTWIVGFYMLLNYVAGYLIMVAMATTGHGDNTQWGYIKSLAALKPQETPWLLALLIAGAAISIVLCLWGNLLLSKHWREKRKTTETPAAPPAMEGPPQP